jgi:hypothetical protein
MGHARANHTSTLLADGRVLIAGGDAEGIAEIYDPATDRFVDAAGSLSPVPAIPPYDSATGAYSSSVAMTRPARLPRFSIRRRTRPAQCAAA